MSGHIALLGDSTIDNRSYTNGQPDVVSHLRSMLPMGWKTSLLAIDGATTKDLPSQLAELPRDVTHLIVSVGGNDILMNRDILALPVSSTTQALQLFGARVRDFEAAYVAAITAATAQGKPTTLCTVYNGKLDPIEAPLARVALTIFNDAILRTAFERGLPVIDLRLVCREPSDYANPIEPSGSGGRKIAEAIASSLKLHNRIKSVSTVFTG